MKKIWKKIMKSGLVMAVVALVAYVIAKWIHVKLHLSQAYAEVSNLPNLLELAKDEKKAKEYMEKRMDELAQADQEDIIEMWKARFQ